MTRSDAVIKLPLPAQPALSRVAAPAPLAVDPFNGDIAVDILLLPGFHLGDLSAFADVFSRVHAAAFRREAKRRRSILRLIALDPTPVAGSCGSLVTPASDIDLRLSAPNLLLLAGQDVSPAQCQGWLARLNFWLRHRLRSGARIVAVGGAPLLLAEAGLLAGRTAAAPWQSIDAWQEMHKDVRFDDRLFFQDGQVTTCSGNGGTLDLALHCVARLLGDDVARDVADQLNYERPRDGAELQRPRRFTALGIEHPGFLKALTLMHREIEHPLDTGKIARDAGLCLRQLQRLFRRQFGLTPSEYYLRCRLDRARKLLCLTAMKVTEVAVATGFVSMSHFSRCYRARFGASPKRDRQLRGPLVATQPLAVPQPDMPAIARTDPRTAPRK